MNDGPCAATLSESLNGYPCFCELWPLKVLFNLPEIFREETHALNK